MNATVTADVKDVGNEEVVRRGLNQVRDILKEEVTWHAEAVRATRDYLIQVRPSGLLTVDEMAAAVGKSRNYVDSVWSSHGETVKGKQTRTEVTSDGPAARAAYERLSELAEAQRKAEADEKTARASRDHAVVIAYNTRILGPSDIASEVGIDRNHVLRIARKNGIGPRHRTGTRNQYTGKGKRKSK